MTPTEIQLFAVIDADTEVHVASIEAATTKQAVERFMLIRSSIKHVKTPGSFWQVVEIEPEDDGVQVFKNELFVLMESANSTKH